MPGTLSQPVFGTRFVSSGTDLFSPVLVCFLRHRSVLSGTGLFFPAPDANPSLLEA
jgi:hypothetical protein